MPPMVPGSTREAEVRAAFGAPSRIWHNPDGTRTFEYATQPAGSTCWMVTLDADGHLVEALDALSDAGQARIQSGMTEAEVERLLGRVRTIVHFRLSGETVWDWNIDNTTGPGIATRFNVHFKDGRVVRTSRSFEFMRDGPISGGFGLR
jgi:hypothetical protein